MGDTGGASRPFPLITPAEAACPEVGTETIGVTGACATWVALTGRVR